MPDHSVGSQIAGFVYRHFDILTILSRMMARSGDDFISEAKMKELAESYDTPIDRLLKHRIVRQVEGGYEIRGEVAAFVTFANNEFSIRSPESVKKFHRSLVELYEKLLVAEDANDLIFFAERTIAELSDFSNSLEGAVTGLMDDILVLKKESAELLPKERFDRTTRLIREYAEPMEEIVSDRSDSILQAVREIERLALVKGETMDRNVADKMVLLWKRADRVHRRVEEYGRKIFSELTVLRKMERSSEILSAAVTWLKAKRPGVDETGLASKYKIAPHPREFPYDAALMLEEMASSAKEIEIPLFQETDFDLQEREGNHFDEEAYCEEIKRTLPVEHIFGRIHEDMKRYGMPSYQAYCRALSVLDRFCATFSPERMVLEFPDAALDVPLAHIPSEKHRMTKREGEER